MSDNKNRQCSIRALKTAHKADKAREASVDRAADQQQQQCRTLSVGAFDWQEVVRVMSDLLAGARVWGYR